MSYEDAVIRIGNKGTIIDITMYEVSANGSSATVVNLSQGNAFQFEFMKYTNCHSNSKNRFRNRWCFNLYRYWWFCIQSC